MYTRSKFVLPWLILLVFFLAGCGHQTKFVAPEIEPPLDLIPGYVPDGYELISGFELPGAAATPGNSNSDDVSYFTRVQGLDLKSPKGNEIQGVYYRNSDRSIVITKSHFPDGNLDLWRTAYDTSQPALFDCACAGLRLFPEGLPARVPEIQEERSIHGTRVAILKGPGGWTTVFVRGDYLLTVESGLPLEDGGISLEENLKIVASLLEE